MDFNYLLSLIVGGILGLMIMILYHKSRKLVININLLLTSLIVIEFGIVFLLFPDSFVGNLGWPVLSLGFIVLYLHYSRLISNRPNLPFTILIFVLYLYAYTNHFIMIYYLEVEGAKNGLTFSFQSVNDIPNFMDRIVFLSSNLAAYLCNIFIFTYSLTATLRINRRVKKSYTRWDVIAQSLLNVYAWCQFLGYVWPLYQEILSNIAIIFVFAGILLWTLSFYRNPDYVYLLPFPIHSFMIYNTSGLLCYSQKMVPVGGAGENEDLLITGAFTAISALIKETLGQGANIHHINAAEYQIFFHHLQNQRGTLVVIAFGDSGYFPLSMRRIDALIDQPLIEEINGLRIDLLEIKPRIDVLIKKCFPYVEFSR